MSITPLSAARIAGELGLAGGTITGGAYAAKYSGQVNKIVETKNKEIQKEKTDKQIYFSTRGELRNKARDMVVKFQNVKTFWGAYSKNFSGQYKHELNWAIEEAYKATTAFSAVDKVDNQYN